jgi:hypothetical protein
MYPEGMLVQVVENTNNHWFEVGEFIRVGKSHPNKKLYPDCFRGNLWKITHGKKEIRLVLGLGLRRQR